MGKMGSEWREVKLADHVDFLHGFAFKGEYFNDDGNGNILVTPGNFEIGGGFKSQKFKYYSGPDATEYFLSTDELIVSMTDLSKAGDTLGSPALVPPPVDGKHFLHNQRIGRVVFKTGDLNKYFLYYLMRSSHFHSHVLGSATGSTVRHTAPSRLAEFKTYIPPLSIQRQITAILSAFDDKIELNRQMNRTLEQMARALFKSWFVDFDPVRAKMRGEQPEGMDAATAALFPSELVEVDGREVPKGWEWGTVGDIANQWKEQINPSQHPDSTFAHFSIPAFDAGKQPILEKGQSIKSNKFTVPNGAILVSKLNPSTPRIWDVEKPEDTDFSVCSTEFIPFVVKQSEYVPLLFLALSSKTFVQALANQASGTSNSHQRVKPADIGNAPVSLPSEAVISAFGELTIPMLGSIKHNIQESTRLAQLRDALLPKLLSGEVDVREWEGME